MQAFLAQGLDLWMLVLYMQLGYGFWFGFWSGMLTFPHVRRLTFRMSECQLFEHQNADFSSTGTQAFWVQRLDLWMLALCMQLGFGFGWTFEWIFACILMVAFCAFEWWISTHSNGGFYAASHRDFHRLFT